MLKLIQIILFTFAALFPVLNPFGAAMIFLNVASGLSDHDQAKLALRVAFNTFLLLTVVLLTGAWILRFFGITVPIIQVGGGLVVACIGWNLLNKPEGVGQRTYTSNNFKEAEGLAFYPLTMPITAGPGCIAVTMAIGAHEVSSYKDALLSEIGILAGILLASLVVFLSYRYAGVLTRKLGSAGTLVIMKLAAFLNFCIGIEIMWHGVQSLVLSLR
jgi:multiple antibiotic resistance protein